VSAGPQENIALPADAPPLQWAQAFGLRRIGLRPPLRPYLSSLWQRRFFTWAYARAQNDAVNSENRLGQLWQLLNPVLNVAVYFLVFGVIFKQSKAIPNFLAFLVIGVFTFTFTQKATLAGAKAITNNLGLVRALHFPRAVLPASVTIRELITHGYAILVMLAIVLLTREPLTWRWLLLPAIVALQTVFNLGLVFFFSRLTDHVVDVGEFLPFAVRVWFYLSGVVYVIQDFSRGTVKTIMEANPASIYIELTRGALMQSYNEQYPTPAKYWVYGLVWAVVTVIVGFLYFWRAEASYGRG